MSSPDPKSPARGFAVAGRALAAVAVVVVGGVFVLSAWLAVSSRFGLAAGDPHGYGLIFGTVLAILAGLVTAVLLPLVFARRHWGRAFALSLASFAVLLVLLIVSLVTA